MYESLDNFDNRKPKPGYSTLTLRKKGKHKSSWHINEKFSTTLCTVSGLNCDVKRNVIEVNFLVDKLMFGFAIKCAVVDRYTGRLVSRG